MSPSPEFEFVDSPCISCFIFFLVTGADIVCSTQTQHTVAQNLVCADCMMHSSESLCSEHFSEVGFLTSLLRHANIISIGFLFDLRLILFSKNGFLVTDRPLLVILMGFCAILRLSLRYFCALRNCRQTLFFLLAEGSQDSASSGVSPTFSF